MSKIIELKAGDFMRIEAAEINFPENGTIEIAGKNKQGKSSVIDAIWAILGGQKASPQQPIRKGALSATGEIKLTDLTVRRIWDSRGSRIVVANNDGTPLAMTPQALLDTLLDRYSFDPLVFMMSDSDKQAEALRRVVGLDFTEHDAKREKIFTERRDINRRLKEKTAQIGGMRDLSQTARIDISELTKELQRANTQNEKIQADISAVAEISRNMVTCEENISKWKKEIREIEKKIERENQRLTEFQEHHVTAQSKIKEKVDTKQIIKRMEVADQINKDADDFEKLQTAREELNKLTVASDRMTKKLDDLDREKQNAIENANYPVPGLGLTGDTVTLNGIPFEQCSTAEQILTSLRISACQGKKLKVITIRQGSLLDDESLALVAKWAKQNDFQVLIERVGDDIKNAGVLIEEGKIKTSKKLPSKPRV